MPLFIEVNSSSDYASSVFATDLDGDADVLSASSFDDTLAWYENTDGQGDPMSIAAPENCVPRATSVRTNPSGGSDIGDNGLDQDCITGFDCSLNWPHETST